MDGDQKYPRTPHLEGSGIQKGDDPARIALAALPSEPGDLWVVEEKVDGANAGFGFDGAGDLRARSRGHFLDAANRNAPRERDWTLFKDWLAFHRDAFLDRFEDRFAVYGEWMQIVHSVYYNRLPDYFLEFDVWDRAIEDWLDTETRRALCAGLPIASVPVLYRGPPIGMRDMMSLLGPSVFRTPRIPSSGAPDWAAAVAAEPRWEDDLLRSCALVGDDPVKRLAKLDREDRSEGHYLKVERGGRVIGRYKWVRPGFVQTILGADEHWQSRFPVPNLLEAPVAGYPAFLARTRGAAPAYDPDDPRSWAPWAPGLAAPTPVRGPR